MAWTTLNYALNSVLTSTKMSQNQDNFAAIMAKASGAPVLANDYIVTAMILNSQVTEAKLATAVSNQLVTNGDSHDHSGGDGATIAYGNLSGLPTLGSIAALNSIAQGNLDANSVGQSEVKTTYQQIQTNGSGATTHYATGGVYVIGAQHYHGHSSGTGRWDWWTDDHGGYASEIQTNDGAYSSYYLRLHYINASPPYDLGDGEVPLFVYAKMNPDGSIAVLNIAPDPPWAYNGPTNITPSGYKKQNGILIPYQKRKDMSAMLMTKATALAAGITALDEYNAAFRAAPEIEIEITQDIKNADMNIIPSAIKDTSNVVILDTMSPVLQEMLEMMKHDEFDVAEYISNWCKIDNRKLSRAGPTGLDVVGFSKRLTRR